MGQAAHQWIGLFDLFRIGVGPSSSHTVGPMIAAASFAATLKDVPVARLRVELFGSLALTGKGHATDVAIILGLTGAQPETLDPDEGIALVERIRRRQRLPLHDGREVPFDPAGDIVFLPREMLPRHPNALRITAIAEGGEALSRVYYSIGGGFVLDEEGAPIAAAAAMAETPVPHPFTHAADLLARAEAAGLSIAGLMHANEISQRSPADVDAGIERIWAAMRACTERGLRGEGELPGGLRVRR
ncbi:serine dehydratase beta chain, partial [Teichococcus wenyumeiae]